MSDDQKLSASRRGGHGGSGGGPVEIPSRRVLVNHPNEMPSNYCTTPGGTIFGTTPGGTRIIYERNFLLQMRNSPHSKTPPKNLPPIPGVTSPKDSGGGNAGRKFIENGKDNTHEPHLAEEPQFEMDI